jgi:hypothetical protein
MNWQWSGIYQHLSVRSWHEIRSVVEVMFIGLSAWFHSEYTERILVKFETYVQQRKFMDKFNFDLGHFAKFIYLY